MAGDRSFPSLLALFYRYVLGLSYLYVYMACQQELGHTLLIKAALKGQSALVEKFLLAGANIEATDNVGN